MFEDKGVRREKVAKKESGKKERDGVSCNGKENKFAL